MKKIKLTEKDLTRIISKVIIERQQIKEQNSAFDWESPDDGWKFQKEAKEKGKYCKTSYRPGGEPSHFEGQYCAVETNWYDWESSPGVKTHGITSTGKWKCGVGCVVSKGERG